MPKKRDYLEGQYNQCVNPLERLRKIYLEISSNGQHKRCGGIMSSIPEQYIKEITLEITRVCPLNCSICSSSSERSSKDGDLNYEEIKKIIDEGIKLGLEKLLISGGEPLSFPHIFDVIEYAKNNNIYVELYSCGNKCNNNSLSPLGTDILTQLERRKLDKIIFTIHGSNSDTHDNITQMPLSYDNLIKTLDIFKESDVQKELHFVPVKTNYTQIPEIIEIAKKYSISTISILRFVPQGRGLKSKKVHSLDKKEIYNLSNIIKSCIDKKSDDDPCIRLGSPLNCFNIKGEKSLTSYCSAGNGKITIRPDGHVIPCVSLKWCDDNNPSDNNNCKKYSLPDIIEQSQIFLDVKEYNIDNNSNTKCRSCLRFSLCKGGCYSQKRLIDTTGKCNTKDPYCICRESENNSNNGFTKIDDGVLIQEFKSNIANQNIKFISDNIPEIRKYYDNIQSILSNLDDNSCLYKQIDIIKELWKSLLSNAIVYLKSKDTREDIHDDKDYGVENLARYLDSFNEYEGLLYGSDRKYRDHISHMFCVYLLGDYVIRKSLNGYEHISIAPEKMGNEITFEDGEKEAMWCIIALTHDLGYPFSAIKKINKLARGMLENFGVQNFQELAFNLHRQPLYDHILNFISSGLIYLNNDEINEKSKTLEKKYLTHPQFKYFLKLSSSFENYKHGLFSSILLMKNLVYFLESDYSDDIKKPLNKQDAKQFLIKNTILRSIAAHTCDDIYFLRVQEFPFLLFIFDEMHDWQRPRIDAIYDVKTPDTSLKIYNFNTNFVNYSICQDYSGIQEEKDNFFARLLCDNNDKFTHTARLFKRRLRSALGKREFGMQYQLEEIYPDYVNNRKATSPKDKSKKITIQRHTYTYCDNSPDCILTMRDGEDIPLL